MRPKEAAVVILALLGAIPLFWWKGSGIVREQLFGVLFGVWISIMFVIYVFFTGRSLRVIHRSDMDLIWVFSKMTVLLCLFYSALNFGLFEQAYNKGELIMGLALYSIIALGVLIFKFDEHEH